MDLDMIRIGERIKNRRLELNLTQMDIKEKVGISSGNISDIERGNRIPSANNLYLLSVILECSMEYILTGESPKSESPILSDIGDSSRELLSIYNDLSEDDQEEVLMIAKMKHNRAQKERKKDVKSYLSGSGNSTIETA